MTETQMQISNWDVPEVGAEGRFVMITDGPDGEFFIAELPERNAGGDVYGLADAIGFFSSTYDTGEATEPVKCTARLFVDGEEAESGDFGIEIA